MDEREVRVNRLSRARRADSDDRRQRVLAVIDGLAANSRPMPIAELARRAKVHRSFLYRHPDLYELAVATPLRKHFAELVDERDRLRAQNNERAGILLHLASVLGGTPIRVERDMPEAVAKIIAERDRLRDEAEQWKVHALNGASRRDELTEERDRLRAVVEAARATVAGIEFQNPGGVTEPVPINRLADLAAALRRLDVSGPMGRDVAIREPRTPEEWAEWGRWDETTEVGPSAKNGTNDPRPYDDLAGNPPDEVIRLLREALDAAISYVFALEGQKDTVVIRARQSYEAALDALEEAEPSDSTESPVGSPGSQVAAVPPTGGRDVGSGNPDVPPEVQVWHLIDREAEKLTGTDRNVITGWLDGTIRPLLLGPDENEESTGARIKREGEEGRHILLDRMKSRDARE